MSYHPDMGELEYRAVDAINQSTLSILHESSPMHVEYRRRNPQPRTETQIIGAALHCAVLRPNDFSTEFPIASQCSAAKKSGEACKNSGTHFCSARQAWFCGVHRDETCEVVENSLTGQQFGMICAMADSILRNRAAAEVIRAEGDNEASGFWSQKIHMPDGDYTLNCKGRFDAVRPTWDAIVELKTTQSAKRDDFIQSIESFGYHRQAAFYCDGYAKAREVAVPNHFIIIAVEKSAPYAVACYRLKGESIDMGRVQIAKLLNEYAICKKFNNWPGYSDGFEDVTLSPYAARRIMRGE